MAEGDSPNFVEETDDAGSFRKAQWHRDRMESGVGNANLAQSHAITGHLKIQLRAQDRKKQNQNLGKNFAFR